MRTLLFQMSLILQSNLHISIKPEWQTETSKGAIPSSHAIIHKLHHNATCSPHSQLVPLHPRTSNAQAPSESDLPPLSLHLMIAPNSLVIAGRHTTGTALARQFPRRALLTLSHSTRLRRRLHSVGRPIALVLTSPLAARSLVDIIVRHRAPLAAILRQAVVVRLRVFRDDVPGVHQAGDETQAAEREVDEGVGAAETSFHPYCRGVSVMSGEGRWEKGRVGLWG